MQSRQRAASGGVGGATKERCSAPKVFRSAASAVRRRSTGSSHRCRRGRARRRRPFAEQRRCQVIAAVLRGRRAIVPIEYAEQHNPWRHVHRGVSSMCARSPAVASAPAKIVGRPPPPPPRARLARLVRASDGVEVPALVAAGAARATFAPGWTRPVMRRAGPRLSRRLGHGWRALRCFRQPCEAPAPPRSPWDVSPRHRPSTTSPSSGEAPGSLRGSGGAPPEATASTRADGSRRASTMVNIWALFAVASAYGTRRLPTCAQAVR